MSAQLTYYIFEGVLTGFAGGQLLHISALSGGRGGTTTKGVESDAVNNPYATGVKTTEHKDPTTGKMVHGDGDIHGGPIPPGQYRIAIPALHTPKKGHKFMAAVLTATHPNTGKGHRDGFLIHGTGPHGSDGCIVPTNRDAFDKLMSVLKSEGGGTLQVLQAMNDSAFV